MPQNASLSAAFQARVGDDTPGTLARGTSPGNTEETLLITYLSASAASLATNRSFTRSSPRTATLFTNFVTPHGDLGLSSKDSLLEVEV